MVGFESEFEQNGQSPQGDQVVDEGKEDLSNPDDDQSMQSPDISANANFNFYITTLTITGSGTLTESMEPGEANAYAWFNIYWRDEGGGAQNFDGSLEGRAGSRQTTTTANVSSVENLTWFHYTYTLIWTPRRYGIVQLCMNGSASFTSCGFFGFSKNRGNSYCTSRYTGGVDSSGHGVNVYLFYIYNSTWTEDESTARSGSNSTTTGTYYIYFREQYELYYRDNGGDNGPGSQSFYAGLSTTLSTSRPDRTGYTFLGWSTSSTATSASYTPGVNYTFSGDIDLYAVWRANVYTVTLNKNNGSGGTSTVYLRYNTGWYSNSGATTSISSVTRPSRTGYTFQGYYTETSGGTQVINSSGSFVSGRLTYTAEDDTLYARWEINEYTLTVRFYPYGYSSLPTLNIRGTGCTVTSSTYSTYRVYRVNHDYQTGSVSVRFTMPSASSSNAYYLSFSTSSTTRPSTNSTLFDSSGDSHNYSWAPTSNRTLYVYAYRRYTINYNSNNGTGSVGSTYKIYGTSAKLATNTFTRPGYYANGWNTNSAGTGTHYSNGASFSTNANTTLYAQWEKNVYSVDINILSPAGEQSDNIGSFTAYYSYNGQTYGDCTDQPYNAVRYNETIVLSNIIPLGECHLKSVSCNNGILSQSGGTYTYTATMTNTPSDGFDAVITIQMTYLQQDSDGNYYIEDGKYPQSYVGNSMNTTLSNSATVSGSTITYFNGTSNVSIPIYTYGGNEYARLQATNTITIQTSVGQVTFTSGRYYFFEVEPIRWIVTDQSVINANGVMTNKTLVSDKVLLASAVTNQTVSEGWAFTSSQMFSNMSGINSYTNAGHDVNSSVTYYRYGNAGQQDKVVTTNRTENGMRVASVDEVEQNTSDMRAYASDLVCFLLGINSNQYANYWTRTLGTNLTAAGMDTSSWLSRVFGVRFAMTGTWS